MTEKFNGEKKEGKLTGERDGRVDGEDTCVATDVTEFGVGEAREDFAAVATEELEGGFWRLLGGFVYHG